MAKITSKTTLEKILEDKKSAEILVKRGVPCMACPYASFELDKLKIGQVCKMYGINLKNLLADLNKKN